jgi:hypothetical protein
MLLTKCALGLGVKTPSYVKTRIFHGETPYITSKHNYNKTRTYHMIMITLHRKVKTLSQAWGETVLMELPRV